jgi:hypothetical protein
MVREVREALEEPSGGLIFLGMDKFRSSTPGIRVI